jgi:hypothetical protein
MSDLMAQRASCSGASTARYADQGQPTPSEPSTPLLRPSHLAFREWSAQQIILTELIATADGRTNSVLLGHLLEQLGFRNTRSELEIQLHALARCGAVTVDQIEDFFVITVTEKTLASLANVSRPESNAPMGAVS